MSGIRERKEFNFLVGDNISDEERAFFIKLIEELDGTSPPFTELPDSTTFPDILALAGVFQSKTLARKNGWGLRQEATFKSSKDFRMCFVNEAGMFIPLGFIDFWAGKGKTIRVTIFKTGLDIDD